MTRHFTILFERSGGFTGIPVTYFAESSKMTEEDSEKLWKLIDTADLKEIEMPSNAPRGFPDQMSYHLKINFEEENYELLFSDKSLPEKAWPLIRELTRLSRLKTG